MAWRFVRQPNGLYARFSDPVDDFTHFNLSRSDCARIARQKGCHPWNVQQKLRNADCEETDDLRTSGKNGARWVEALTQLSALRKFDSIRRAQDLGGGGPFEVVEGPPPPAAIAKVVPLGGWTWWLRMRQMAELARRDLRAMFWSVAGVVRHPIKEWRVRQAIKRVR